MASGSYGDCIKLWDVNPSNRDKDGEYLKCVNSIPVVGGEIGASVVEWVRELDLVRPVGSFHGGGRRAGASLGKVVETEGCQERHLHSESESRFICLSIFRTKGLLIKQVGMLLPEGLVSDHIAVQNDGFDGPLGKRLDLFLGEGGGDRVRTLFHSLQNVFSRLADNDASLLEELGLVVVVDAEAREEKLVLVLAQASVQDRLRRCRGFAALQDERPEGGVVQVIDVGIGLSPRYIVADVLLVTETSGCHLVGGIKDDASVEGRRVLQRRGHVLRPVEQVHGRELGHNGGQNLDASTVEEGRFPLEDEGILVAFANRQNTVAVRFQDLGRHLIPTQMARSHTLFMSSSA